ncbi:transcription factor A, mitochondrial [Melospiza melodia melodia]|uniref:transcription factor A, mitochondrial n=1 Tax=Melospiza georgiana TaxID=44398 RepID=UPI0025AD7A0A|nr:transcription factor A, mitochondrial [Melospiza georgiana]
MAAAAALLGRAAGLGLGLVAAAGGRRLLRCGAGAALRERGTGALLGAAVLCRPGGAAERCLSRGTSSNPRPKRPLTAYFRFVMDNRPAFKEKNPEASNTELVKKLASAWKELPASQKQVYEEARKTDWKRYGEQLAAYKAQLTPAQAAALKEERRKQLARRRSIRAKRELNQLGKPKRARSGFNIFLSENFQESEGNSPVAKLKKLFDTWKKMSAAQKQPYLQLAQDDKVRYENEMKSWEAKMIELGREDLVRSRRQRLKKKPAETAKQTETAKAKASSSGKKAKLKKSEE